VGYPVRVRLAPYVILWLLSGNIVHAATNPYLESGRRSYEKLRFAEAIVQLEAARRVPTLAADEQIETLSLLGKALLAEGRRRESILAFSELLAFEPSYDLPADSAPKVRDVFMEAKRAVFPPDHLLLRALPSPQGTLRFSVENPWSLATRVILYQRTTPSEPWKAESIPVTSKEVSRPVLKNSPSVEWYVEAVDEQGRVRASLHSEQLPGTVLAPLALSPSATPPRLSGESTVKSKLGAWLLTLGAVALAGGAVYFAVDSGRLQRAAKNSSLPPGDWADTAQAAHVQANREATAALSLGIAAGAAAAGGGLWFAW